MIKHNIFILLDTRFAQVFKCMKLKFQNRVFQFRVFEKMVQNHVIEIHDFEIDFEISPERCPINKKMFNGECSGKVPELLPYLTSL